MKLIGYTLIGIAFLPFLLIGLIIPAIPWWVGFVAVGSGVFIGGLVALGISLIGT